MSLTLTSTDAHPDGRSGAEVRKGARLDLRLRPLVLGRRVDDDAAAHGDREPPARAAAHERRADRDGEIQIAGGAEPARRARVGAPRDRLELVDDLHGAALGRARDRAARERRLEQAARGRRRRAGGRAPCSRGAAPWGARARRARPLDGDAARLADAPEIVALEVDDHDVLGAILGRRAQGLAHSRPARARALDGAGLDAARASSARKRSGEFPTRNAPPSADARNVPERRGRGGAQRDGERDARRPRTTPRGAARGSPDRRRPRGGSRARGARRRDRRARRDRPAADRARSRSTAPQASRRGARAGVVRPLRRGRRSSPGRRRGTPTRRRES